MRRAPDETSTTIGQRQPVPRSRQYNNDTPFLEFDDDDDERYGAYLPSGKFERLQNYKTQRQ